ncbi:angiopoietin-1 receptor-like [Patiria miniata]|uniref:Receptor protein-tyrosine kinase n=1 Tax=Patiria miniata TaxID=46514 RepID=A0A914ARH5_PATMI|nr:angiopoietin-1 receptor-like [Patiria miniata]
MVTRYFYRAGISGQISLVCYRSSPDTNADLSFGRLPVHLPGAGIESSTSFSDGTISGEYEEQEYKQLPQSNANATGLYYCEGSKGDQATRVYSSVFNYYSWYYPGSRNELLLTKTISKGENVTLSVQSYRASTTYYASWRRIRDGVVTNLTDYDRMSTITIPPSQAKHGDVYAVVDSRYSLSDNKFTLIRLIVRGCVAGKWGPPTCDGVCDLCYNGGVCDDKTGDCICPPGFMGPNCLTACPTGYFGWDCEYRCGSNPFIGSCSNAQFGLPDPFGITCVTGYRGYACSNSCPSGRFGAECLQECHCPSNDCYRYTGVCSYAGCAEGWSGTNCQIPDICPVGYYGLNCLSKCRCLGDAACDKDTGYCSVGCAPGITCVSRQCEAGYFGEDCRKECHCLDDAACDGITGSCQSGRCLEQFQTDETGICKFVLPVLSQPPEVRVKSTSAVVTWKAWGSHPMDSGDGPIIGYEIYQSVYSSSSQNQAFYISAIYQPPNSFSFNFESLQQLTVYNFSVAAVREGEGGEGPRSPVTTIRTEPQGMNKSISPSATIAGSNLGLIVAVCVLVAVIVIAVVVDYLRFRRLSRGLSSKNRAEGGGLNMVSLMTVYDNPIAKEEPARMSVHMEGYEDMGNEDASSAYENVAQPWSESLIIPIGRLSIGYKVIGTGHFGEVRMATVILDDGQSKAAVKQLKSNSSAGDRHRFMEEYRTLSDIGAHPNIVNILAVCFDEGIVYVALGYQPNGDLRSYLRNARSPADDSRSSMADVKLLQFAVGVAKGMQHIAASGVIHRKLAARNILLDDNLVAKVSGFGQARCAEAIVEKSKVSLPPRWLSFESLKTNTYTSKSDVWSFGILLWEIATLGATPYSGITSASLATRFENGYRMPKPSNCDSEMYELMLQCWKEDPKDRPPFKRLASVLGTMAHSHKQQRYIQMLPKSESQHYLNIRPDQDDN